MWFEELVGFTEKSPAYVMQNLSIESNKLVSKANQSVMTFGELQIPTLGELKQISPNPSGYHDSIKVREIVADVKALHADPANADALFQAASQFNLLEMVHPSVTPEQGVSRYANDHTQGPACAIACGAGTIYRNYFVSIDGQMGQCTERQIDCLKLIGDALENDKLSLWNMRNGYALINPAGIEVIDSKLATLSPQAKDALKDKLQTGIQWQTQVTLPGARHKVSQIYCAALPVAYCDSNPVKWERFARLVLEAAYESTLYAALLNFEKYHCNTVYLTLLGGGVFGNDENWILESLQHTLQKFTDTPLDVRIVSYAQSNPRLRQMTFV